MAAEAISIKASSHVKGVSYDSETQELVVVFDRASYLYSGIPIQVANGFRDAPSAGQYLDQQIKGVYQFQKL